MDTITPIALGQLHESPFNPRRTFTGMEELAANIIAEGRIHEPLLVRPRTGPGLGDDCPDSYEIVFGHRRYRAAELARMATVPCMVRAMTDEQARRAQISENLQRADVHPIEEAEGYKALMQEHQVSADQLAAQTGKSRSYIYSRLMLLKACDTVRTACLAGQVGSETALLISRLRTDKLQRKALGYIDGKAYDLKDGGTKSYRHIRDLLRERFTLGLKDALFDTADAQLLPDAGACTACPKRSGNAPEFADLVADAATPWGQVKRGSADLCTDPDCFDAKKRAALTNQAATLRAKGMQVVDGNKARAAIGADSTIKGAYVALKAVREALKKIKGNKPATVTIQDPRTGKTVEAVRRDDLQAAGLKVSPLANSHYQSGQAQAARREAESKLAKQKATAKTAQQMALLQAVRAAIASRPRDAFDLALVASAALGAVPWNDRDTLAGLWGEASIDALTKRMGNMDKSELTTLLMDCALVDNVFCAAHDLRSTPGPLLAAAAHYGIAPASIAEPTPALAPAQTALTPAPAARATQSAKPVAKPRPPAGEQPAPVGARA